MRRWRWRSNGGCRRFAVGDLCVGQSPFQSLARTPGALNRKEPMLQPAQVAGVIVPDSDKDRIARDAGFVGASRYLEFLHRQEIILNRAWSGIAARKPPPQRGFEMTVPSGIA